MRTNFASLFLAVGMGLIVVLLGFGALSMAGLVGFSGEEVEAEQMALQEIGGCGVIDSPMDSSAVTQVAMTSEELAGDAIFKANCAQCHAVHGQVVGPALANITKRRRIDWIVSWVHNSAKVVASGDEYGVKLFSDNGQQQMPSFPDLSKKDIQNIVAWINSPTGNTDRAGGYTIED